MISLQVYFSEECWSCLVTKQTVEDAAARYPTLKVELIDVSRSAPPAKVIAVPTYLLNGRIISMGNPKMDLLAKEINQAIESNLTLDTL